LAPAISIIGRTHPKTAPIYILRMSAKKKQPNPLSSIAQEVAEFYAVMYPERPGQSTALPVLNQARRNALDEPAVKPKEMQGAIAELVAANLLVPSTKASYGANAQGPMAMPGSITRFCEAAIERGTADEILEGYDERVFAYHNPYYGYSTSDTNPLIEQHVRIALIEDAFELFQDEQIPNNCWTWLTEPEAESYLSLLPLAHRQQACTHCLARLTHYMQPIEPFASTCDAVLPNARHKAITARALAFQGKFELAKRCVAMLEASEESLDNHTAIECQSLHAMIAALQGDDEAALQGIKKTLELERGDSRKKILYPDNLCFGIAAISLARLGTTEARALLKSLLHARDKLKISSYLDMVLFAAQQADQPSARAVDLHMPGHPSIMSVLYAIASRWHKDMHYQKDHTSTQNWLENVAWCARHGGYGWAACELQRVIEETYPNPKELNPQILAQFKAAGTTDQQAQSLGFITLTKLVTTLEPWEFSLRELEQLSLNSKGPKGKNKNTANVNSKRLVWQLDTEYPDAVRVHPVEQSLGKDGNWTAGRRVALKRLIEQASSMTHLIEQDIKASRTIRKEASNGWGGGTPSYHTSERTIFQLTGHPLVFNEEGQRIDVVECPPVLKLREENGKVLLTIEPFYEGSNYQSLLDTDNRRLNVTNFSAAHKHIAAVIPPLGIAIPVDANDRLQSILKAISGDISVQGDTDVANNELHQGTPDPLLAIEPSGDSIRMHIRVEPLTDSAVFFDAGAGGSVVYVQSHEGTVSVQRDLNDEQARVQAMVAQCPTLASLYDGRAHVVVDHANEALEILEEIQQVGVRCIWPDDAPFGIKARASIKQVSLNVKSAKEWFSASGTLQLGTEKDSLSLDTLLKLMAKQPNTRFIELKKGEFLALSHTLKQQLDTLQAFSKPISDEATAIQTHPMALLALEPLMESATIKGDQTWKQKRLRMEQAFKQTPNVPSTLQADLRAYQLQGFSWLNQLGQVGAGACLADDMGLGKTVQALALLLSRAEQGPALVVAPTSVVGNWMQETQRFAPSLNACIYADSTIGRQQVLSDLSEFDLLIVSYGLLVNDIEHLNKIHWASVVLDEAQAIKNANTKRAKSVCELKADFRVVTTGTPVQNSLMDLHSLFSFLNPELLGTEAAFRRRFAVPITRDNNEQAREQLQLVVSPFLLRRHKRDVLKELPARTEVTLNVKLSPEEAVLYEKLRLEAVQSLEKVPQDKYTGKRKIMILAYLTKLRRLCCNPSLVARDWTGPMSKLDVFSDTISELIASGHKALVFSQFVDHLKIVEAHLKQQGITYQYIDGSTTAKQRTQRVNAFQGGTGDVFLISLTAGGTGLNLTAADYVVHLDPWWNPAVEDQASDRAHRLGQQRPVTVVRMVTSGTIEEQIQELHSTKRDLADSVLADSDNLTLDVAQMMKLLSGK